LHRRRWPLLRKRGERQCGCSSADKRDELPSFHGCPLSRDNMLAFLGGPGVIASRRSANLLKPRWLDQDARSTLTTLKSRVKVYVDIQAVRPRREGPPRFRSVRPRPSPSSSSTWATVTSRPSSKLASLTPFLNASTRDRSAQLVGEPGRKPICIGGDGRCCANAANGSAAPAPPISVMNCRRSNGAAIRWSRRKAGNPGHRP
jgi:hypothetical protein